MALATRNTIATTTASSTDQSNAMENGDDNAPSLPPSEPSSLSSTPQLPSSVASSLATSIPSGLRAPQPTPALFSSSPPTSDFSTSFTLAASIEESEHQAGAQHAAVVTEQVGRARARVDEAASDSESDGGISTDSDDDDELDQFEDAVSADSDMLMTPSNQQQLNQSPLVGTDETAHAHSPTASSSGVSSPANAAAGTPTSVTSGNVVETIAEQSLASGKAAAASVPPRPAPPSVTRAARPTISAFRSVLTRPRQTSLSAAARSRATSTIKMHEARALAQVINDACLVTSKLDVRLAGSTSKDAPNQVVVWVRLEVDGRKVPADESVFPVVDVSSSQAMSPLITTTSVSPPPAFSLSHSSISSSPIPSPSPSSSPSSPAPSFPYLISKEVVETERRFVSSLDALVTCFLHPWSEAAASVARDPDKLSSVKQQYGTTILDARLQVFITTTSNLLRLNTRFLAEIEAVLQDWSKSPQTKAMVEPPSAAEGAPTLASIFAEYAPLFKLFAAYARDHEVISQLLLGALGEAGGVFGAAAAAGSDKSSSTSSNQSPFVQFVLKQQKDPRCKGQTLESLLIQPVQRLPRYKLLLEELQRKSKPKKSAAATMPSDQQVSQRSLDALASAISQISSVAHHVNESIRHREQNEFLATIEAQFTRRIVLRDREPPRRLLRQAYLKRMTRKGTKTYFFHLFNDCLLYSENVAVGGGSGSSSQNLLRRGSAVIDGPGSLAAAGAIRRGIYKLHRRLNFREQILVADKSVEPDAFQAPESSPSAAGTDASTSTSPEYALEIRSPAKSFIVLFPSCEEKELWLADLRIHIAIVKKELAEEAAAQAAENGGDEGGAASASKAFVAPVWTQDQTATTCSLCSKPFSLFNRRHHCRRCGRLCCALCSRHKVHLRSVDAVKPVRVCDQCMDEENEIDPRAGLEAEAMTEFEAGGDGDGAHEESAADTALNESTVGGKHDGSSTSSAATSATATTTTSSAAPTDPDRFLGAYASNFHRTLFSLSRHFGHDPRLPALFELYLSERSYAAGLGILVSKFVQPMLGRANHAPQRSKIGSILASVPLQRMPSTLMAGSTSTATSTALILDGRPLPQSLVLTLHSCAPLLTLSTELLHVLHNKIVIGDGETGPTSNSGNAQASETDAGDASSDAKPAKGWDPDRTTFGALFLRFAPLFDELYVTFAAHHAAAVRALGAAPRALESSMPVTAAGASGTSNSSNSSSSGVGFSDVVAEYGPSVSTALEQRKLKIQSRQTACASKESEWAKEDDQASSSQPPPSSTPSPVSIYEPSRYATVFDLLQAPLKRIGEYARLLGQIAAGTPEGHPDKIVQGSSADSAAAPSNPNANLLSRAVSALHTASSKVDRALTEAENMSNLAKLQERFLSSGKVEPDLIAPHRVLLKEGPLLRQTRRAHQLFYFHLFNDLVTYSEMVTSVTASLSSGAGESGSASNGTAGATAPAGQNVKFRLHRRIPLMELQVFDRGSDQQIDLSHSPADVHSNASTDDSAPTPYMLELHSPQKSFIVCARTQEDKEDWLETMTLAIKAEERRLYEEEQEQLSSAGTKPDDASLSNPSFAASRANVLLATAPLWAKDSSTDACPLCAKKFTFINRRHHCRKCGRVCCAACSTGRKLLPHIDKAPVRVCDKCK